MIKNILWDLDGTLFDTYPAVTYSISKSLNELGCAVALNQIDSLARRSLDECVHTLAQRFHLDPALIRRHSVEIYRQVPPSRQPLFPGARQVCAWITEHDGLNLIATSRKLESARAFLDAHGLSPLFADIFSTEQGYPCKPDPAMVCAALEKHSLPPAETLLVGHRQIDLQAGQAAGVATCLFGTAEVASLPHLRVQNYAALLAYLENLEKLP